MPKLKQILGILAISSLTTGCESLGGINYAKPICVSKDDVLTTGTKQQIVTFDEALGKPCVKTGK